MSTSSGRALGWPRPKMAPFSAPPPPHESEDEEEDELSVSDPDEEDNEPWKLSNGRMPSTCLFHFLRHLSHCLRLP